ncbi:hypothetical protein BJX61DRAFT_500548 [Aspergillus egyptiacus]|nr:hypothetical protein BJX61DRAFT_500548 [Aspergillus egyptiacus]
MDALDVCWAAAHVSKRSTIGSQKLSWAFKYIYILLHMFGCNCCWIHSAKKGTAASTLYNQLANPGTAYIFI